MKIDALLFDMDGLLIDSERIVKMSWDLAGEDLGYYKLGDHIFNTLGMNRVRRGIYFKEALGEDFPYEEFYARTSVHFYEIMSEQGIDIKPGARELLEYAKSHGYKLALATSSRKEYAAKSLTDIGIYSFFDVVVSGDMVQHSKPDPEVYLKASALLGVDPSNCLALEDAPAGIRSAYAAGTIPILIPDLLEPPEDVVQLSYRKYETLHEVIPLLQANERNRTEEM
jgi:HAD superfamily hydrolase (TIGR01509 family)